MTGSLGRKSGRMVHDALRAAADVSLVADILVKGRRCEVCSRHTRRGLVCCKRCEESGGGEHTPFCSIESGQSQSDATQARLAAARRLRILAAPKAAVHMETLVESREPWKPLTQPDLQFVAERAGSSGGALAGSVATVSTRGRFACRVFGSDRVGCSLCRTKPMAKSCWHSHASSRAHASRLAQLL